MKIQVQHDGVAVIPEGEDEAQAALATLLENARLAAQQREGWEARIRHLESEVQAVQWMLQEQADGAAARRPTWWQRVGAWWGRGAPH